MFPVNEFFQVINVYTCHYAKYSSPSEIWKCNEGLDINTQMT